jgi:hypothetical protein
MINYPRNKIQGKIIKPINEESNLINHHRYHLSMAIETILEK